MNDERSLAVPIIPSGCGVTRAYLQSTLPLTIVAVVPGRRGEFVCLHLVHVVVTDVP